MPSIQFWVPGNPIPKQSFRYSKKGSYQPKRVTEWQELVAWHAKAAMVGKGYLEVRLKVELNFKRKNKRKVDLDNLSKAVLDACNKIVWEDDVQIVDLRITKRVDKEEPGVMITVWTKP